MFYPVGTTDFSAIATKLVGLGADSYTTASGGPVSDSLYYKSLVDAGFKGKFVSYTTITPDQIAKVILIADVEGMTSAIAGIDLPTPTPTGQELKDLWIKAYGKWTLSRCHLHPELVPAGGGSAEGAEPGQPEVADTIAAGIEFPAALGQGKTVPRPDMGNTRCVAACTTPT